MAQAKNDASLAQHAIWDLNWFIDAIEIDVGKNQAGSKMIMNSLMDSLYDERAEAHFLTGAYERCVIDETKAIELAAVGLTRESKLVQRAD